MFDYDDPVAEIARRIWQNDMRRHTMRDTIANRAMIENRRDGLLEALSVVDACERGKREGGAVEMRSGQEIYDEARTKEGSKV